MHKVIIDGVEYRSLTKMEEEAIKLLNDLYCILWSEAHYDPTTEEIGKFAKPLADKVSRLNEILKFKD